MKKATIKVFTTKRSRFLIEEERIENKEELERLSKDITFQRNMKDIMEDNTNFSLLGY